MPNTFVDKFPDGEKHWKEAKKQAEKEGKGDNYAYITGIFKKMVGAKVIANIFTRLRDKDLQEISKSPEGWGGSTKAMKKHRKIDNPFALAWWMKRKGYHPHHKED